jgi:uncharacterized membrane protein YbhN (UPF0104 family)
VTGYGFGISVAWGYALGALLIIVPVFFVVENPMSVLANLRIVDELADIGIVRDVDVGYGFIDGVPEVIAHSQRPLVWNLLILSFLSILAAYVLRAVRQQLTASYVGVPARVANQFTSFFYGRGLNLLFPFGPGELGMAQRLVAGGADEAAATTTIFYSRVFEIFGTVVFLLVGLVLSGWSGGLLPFLISIGVVVGLTLITRPMGGDVGGRKLGTSLWLSLNGPPIIAALRSVSSRLSVLAGLTALALLALVLEVAGLYLLKQAFSTREFHLLADLPLSAFVMAIAVANFARIIPITPGGAGFYELSMVAVFLAYGGDSHAGTTVAILDGVATNLVMLALFLMTLAWRQGRPAILDTWRSFAELSRARHSGAPIPEDLFRPAP